MKQKKKWSGPDWRENSSPEGNFKEVWIPNLVSLHQVLYSPTIKIIANPIVVG